MAKKEKSVHSVIEESHFDQEKESLMQESQATQVEKKTRIRRAVTEIDVLAKTYAAIKGLGEQEALWVLNALNTKFSDLAAH